MSRKPAECGTISGYSRHRRLGEEKCLACREAVSAYNRAYNRRKNPDAKPRKPAECGTTSGYNRHRRLGEQVCSACREAWNAYCNAPHRARADAVVDEAEYAAECGRTEPEPEPVPKPPPLTPNAPWLYRRPVPQWRREELAYLARLRLQRLMSEPLGDRDVNMRASA